MHPNSPPRPTPNKEIGFMRIGKIKYLNCLPYYAGWEPSEKHQFESGTPAQLNQMMREAKIDAAPISSMEYLKNPDSYYLLPDMGIASREFVRSVTLISKKKIEDLNGASIAVTEESLTSTHLLQLILEGKFQIQAVLNPVPSNPKAMLENHDAALLIGNDALFAHPRKWVFRYDLGNLWWQWQNRPFVYAVWAIRRESGLSEAEISEFYQTLKERFLYNSEHLPELVQQQGGVGEFDKLYPKVFGYLMGLQYILDDACWQGLSQFSELGTGHGWCRPFDMNSARSLLAQNS